MARKSYVNSSDIVTASIVYNYNDAGQLGSISSYCNSGCGNNIYYQYDKLGRLLYRSGVGYGQIGFQRDAMGRTKSLQWMATPDEPTSLSYNYDMAGRVTSVVQDASYTPLASYSYDKSGAVDEVMLENGAHVEYHYDSTTGRLTGLYNKDVNGDTFAGFDYTYDNDGLVSRVDIEDGSYVLYDYDDQNRLTDEWRKTSAGSTIYRHQYQYDDAGNRTQHIYTDNVSNSTTFTLTYNDLNQLTQRSWSHGSYDYRQLYEYDDNGNLTQKLEAQNWENTQWDTTELWQYTWDHENRLIQVLQSMPPDAGGDVTLYKKVQFQYCPSCGGNRTGKVVWINDNFDMGSEEQPSWALTKWLRYETLGLDQLRVDAKYDADQDGLDEADPLRTERVTYDSPGAVGYIERETIFVYATPYTAGSPTLSNIYYHYDVMMNVAAVSDYSGDWISGQRFHEDAFGRFSGEGTITYRRITCREYDADTRLYDFHARWYDPMVGRYISADPVLRAELKQPFSPYHFVFDCPTHYVDFTGRSPQEYEPWMPYYDPPIWCDLGQCYPAPPGKAYPRSWPHVWPYWPYPPPVKPGPYTFDPHLGCSYNKGPFQFSEAWYPYDSVIKCSLSISTTLFDSASADYGITLRPCHPPSNPPPFDPWSLFTISVGGFGSNHCGISAQRWNGGDYGDVTAHIGPPTPNPPVTVAVDCVDVIFNYDKWTIDIDPVIARPFR